MNPLLLPGYPHYLITLEIDAPISLARWEAFCASVGLRLVENRDAIRTYCFETGLSGTVVAFEERGVSIRAPLGHPACRTEALLLRSAIEVRWPFSQVRIGAVEHKVALPKTRKGLPPLVRVDAVPAAPLPVHRGHWVECPPAAPGAIVA